MSLDLDLLRPMQRLLYMTLRGAGTVPIELLHQKLYGPSNLTLRRKQQQLGPHISRLNMHLVVRGFRIEPGAQKQTYRMVEHKVAAAKTEKPKKTVRPAAPRG